MPSHASTLLLSSPRRQRGHNPLPHLHLHLLLTFTALSLSLPTTSAAISRPSFTDISRRAGLLRPYGRRIKYGGACVADLDGDGAVDLLFGHHDQRYADLYFGRGDGTFVRHPWDVWVDAHGINAARLSPRSKGMHFIVSRGGSRGTLPHNPLVYSVIPSSRGRQRQVLEVPFTANFTKGRGRSVVFVHVGAPNPKSKGARAPIAFLLNIPVKKGDFAHRAVRPSWAKGRGMRFKIVPIVDGDGFPQDGNSYGMAVDVDGDGRMELLTWNKLRIYKLAWRRGGVLLRDVTESVLPAHLHGLRGVSAVAPLDADGDGITDLYLSRTDRGELKWLRDVKPPLDTSDIFLRGLPNGSFVDASMAWGVPSRTRSQGVTAGDFNNDGWTDLFIPQYAGTKDLFLMNTGRRFRSFWPSDSRMHGAAGDQAAAVDVDNDGMVDLVVSEDVKPPVDTSGILFRELSNGPFVDARRDWGISRPTGWHACGLDDGHITEVSDHRTWQRTVRAMKVLIFKSLFNKSLALKQVIVKRQETSVHVNHRCIESFPQKCALKKSNALFIKFEICPKSLAHHIMRYH